MFSRTFIIFYLAGAIRSRILIHCLNKPEFSIIDLLINLKNKMYNALMTLFVIHQLRSVEKSGLTVRVCLNEFDFA
jgi:hypothetical protein